MYTTYNGCSNDIAAPPLPVPRMVEVEGTNIFDFDNPRSLEKALPGKELHRQLLLLTKKY